MRARASGSAPARSARSPRTAPSPVPSSGMKSASRSVAATRSAIGVTRSISGPSTCHAAIIAWPVPASAPAVPDRSLPAAGVWPPEVISIPPQCRLFPLLGYQAHSGQRPEQNTIKPRDTHGKAATRRISENAPSHLHMRREPATSTETGQPADRLLTGMSERTSQGHLFRE